MDYLRARGGQDRFPEVGTAGKTKGKRNEKNGLFHKAILPLTSDRVCHQIFHKSGKYIIKR